MTIEKTEIDDKPKEDEERAALEAKREEEMDSLREEKKQAELKAAKAEGEAEAMKRNLSQPAQAPQWTDEQWDREGEKYGKTGQQLKADVMLAKGIADASMRPLQEAAEEAKREAKEAREELKRIKEGKSSDKIKQEFLDKNPAIRLHNKEVDEFLSTYPDSDSVNGDALKKRLDLAAKYVKGTVKEMRTSRPSESGSTRMEVGEEEGGGDNPEFDPKGTGNDGAAHLMRKVNDNFGKGLRHSDSIDVYKKSLDDEGRGVSISMDEDIERYNKMRDRDSVGGTRG